MARLLAPNRQVCNLMVFGTILDWNPSEAALTICPLVIAPNWPSN
jgi:hypothetical protein